MEKMYILAAVCIIGTALYIGVELNEKKKMNQKEEVNTPWIKYLLYELHNILYMYINVFTSA